MRSFRSWPRTAVFQLGVEVTPAGAGHPPEGGESITATVPTTAKVPHLELRGPDSGNAGRGAREGAG